MTMREGKREVACKIGFQMSKNNIIKIKYNIILFFCEAISNRTNFQIYVFIVYCLNHISVLGHGVCDSRANKQGE